MTQAWFWNSKKNGCAVTQQSKQLRSFCFLLCSTNQSSYPWHVFAQVNKLTADILLSGNTTATPGNKFRYYWQAKLQCVACHSQLDLGLYSAAWWASSCLLLGGFVFGSVYLTFSEWCIFFSLKHWLLLLRLPMYPLYSPFLTPSHFLSSLKTSQILTISCKKL